MSFVLFGHSFVKRLKRKRGSQFKIELQSKVVPVTCIGEGGLTLSRIRARPRKYYEYLRQANPLVLIIDLGTNMYADLTSQRDSALECSIWKPNWSISKLSRF